jgi:hypothetical protein
MIIEAVDQNENLLVWNITKVSASMKKFPMCLLLLICIALTYSADILLKEEITGNFVSMSANGDTILVLDFESSQLNSSSAVLFKMVATYHRLEARNLRVFVPSPRNYNRPRLTDDGLHMYFINSNTGLVIKASLEHTGITNPYVELVDLDNHACQTAFECKLAVSSDYVAFYSHAAKLVTITLFHTLCPKNSNSILDEKWFILIIVFAIAIPSYYLVEIL